MWSVLVRGLKTSCTKIYFCSSRKQKCAFTGFRVTVSISEDRESLARANNKTLQSHAETCTCLVYSGFLHVSVWSLWLFSARSTQQRSRWTPSWSPGRVSPQIWARAGSVKAIGRVQRKQIFPCAVCSAGFFQLMPYKSLSVGQPARETYRLGNVHTINRSCSLKTIMASVKAQQEIALSAEVENSLRHRRRIGLHSFQR